MGFLIHLSLGEERRAKESGVGAGEEIGGRLICEGLLREGFSLKTCTCYFGQFPKEHTLFSIGHLQVGYYYKFIILVFRQNYPLLQLFFISLFLPREKRQEKKRVEERWQLAVGGNW